MNELIVPLDGSTLSLAALRTAVWLQPHGAGIHVVSAVQDEDARQARARLLAEQVAGLVDSEAVSSEVVVGDPAEVIVAAGAQRPDGMICMATHGRGGLARAVFGSVAETVIRNTHEPLLLTGPRAATDRSPLEGPLVVALDGSPRGEACLAAAAAWSRRYRQPLVLAHIAVDWPGYVRTELGDDVIARIGAAAARYLDHVGSQLSDAGLSVETRVVTGNNVGRELLRIGEDAGAGLHVVASRSRRTLSRLAVGSVTVSLLHHGERPVLVVPAPAQAAAGQG